MMVLGSASPRRREILETLGVPFRVEVADVDESPSADEPAREYVLRVARAKAAAVGSRVPNDVVLTADTTVVLDGRILGKPRDLGEARAMLRALSGRTHEVLTAVVVRAPSAAHLGALGEVATLVRTEVAFRALDDETVERYAASGEGLDKAGAYAIQGLGMGLVREIRGSYTNVVGLPAVETLELLARVGALQRWPTAEGRRG